MRALIVEDDQEISSFLSKGLSEEGYLADVASSGEEAIEHSALLEYDIIILDVLLPGINGMQVCRDIRSGGASTPILMLTARDGVDDRIAGLDAGADDYLVKPFAFGELIARVRALLRRQPTLTGNRTLQVGDLVLDVVTRRAVRGGLMIELTRREYSLLEFMMRHPGQALSRTQLADQIWGYNYSYDSNVVDVYIRYLRRKIDQGFDHKLVQTVRGFGYMVQA